MNSDSNKNGSGKTNNTGIADMKPVDAKVSAAAKAAAKPSEQSISQAGAPQPEVQAPGAEHRALLAAMRTRWSNFADSDLKSVKTREDLSSAVQAKYGITADQATTQVKEWAVGRQF